MKRSWVYGIVLIVVAALASTAIFWPPKQPEPKLPLCRNRAPQEPAETQEIFFKVRLMGSGFITGKDRPSGTFDFHEYTAEDGIELERLVFSYRTQEAANQEMEAMVRTAVQVIERGPRLSVEGKVTGERAVLLMPAEEAGKHKAAVVWTAGKHLRVVQSSSLRHAQAFYEQTYARPERRRVKDMDRERLFRGEAKIEMAVRAYVECFQFEDGIVVKRTTAEYPSVGKAQSGKERIVNEAVRVLDQKPSDAEGVPWVVLRMPASRPREAQIVVLRDHGSTIVMHESSSLHHALGLSDALAAPRVKRAP